MNKKYLIISGVILILTLLLATSFLQKRQDIRQRAAGPENNASSNPNTVNTPKIDDSYSLPLPPEEEAYLAPNDTQAPSISITSPGSGESVQSNSPVNITASAADDKGVSKVEFLINGGIICTATSAPYTCTWNVPDQSGKQYIIVVRGYDQTGNILSDNVVVSSK